MRSSHLLKCILFVSLVGSSAALAATTDTVSLSGSIASTLSVAATDTAGATSLDLSAGEKIAQVADVNMSTNNDAGLTLTATAGNLSHTGTDIAFQVTSVADGATAPDNTGFAAGTHTTTAARGSTDKDLYILYNPAGTEGAGAYTGSIALDVTDN